MVNGRNNKFGAIRTTIDGITFASKAEAKRYAELRLMVMGNVISELELQPKYPIIINDMKVCTYVADFRYRNDRGKMIVEDVKGVKTPVYKLKKKLMASFGVDIVEITM